MIPAEELLILQKASQRLAESIDREIAEEQARERVEVWCRTCGSVLANWQVRNHRAAGHRMEVCS